MAPDPKVIGPDGCASGSQPGGLLGVVMADTAAARLCHRDKTAHLLETRADYLLAEIQRVAERPTPQELAERLLRRPRVSLKTSPSRAVRTERDRR